MNAFPAAELDRWIVAQRPPKNRVDPRRPYHVLVERERSPAGVVEDVGTIFLTNRECPFRCLMCDLWRNTTDERVPEGAIVEQIDWGLAELARQSTRIKRLKLYNAGNFFDAQAIPRADWPGIAELMRPFEAVIVECHPRLVGDSCFEFQDLLAPRLEVAMGLETVHPQALERLNKQMTVADFDGAAKRLIDRGISVRAFILLGLPELSDDEGLAWTKRSLDHAFSIGVECCVVIPTRSGNGAMDRLLAEGKFKPPRIESLEAAVGYGVSLSAGRVFADLWDIERFFTCRACGPRRAERLAVINLTQQIGPPVECDCPDYSSWRP